MRNRCLEKLYSASEIEFITSAQNSILAFWQLWSAKESAYKVWQRLTHSKPVLNSIQFKCLSFDDNTIHLQKDDLDFIIQIHTTRKYIYTAIASSQKSTSKIFKTNREYFHYLSKLKLSGWTLKKSKFNMPYFQHTETREAKLVSLTHDQGWTAIQYEGEFISQKSSQSQE